MYLGGGDIGSWEQDCGALISAVQQELRWSMWFTLMETSPMLKLTNASGSREVYPYFIDRENEAQRGQGKGFFLSPTASELGLGFSRLHFPPGAPTSALHQPPPLSQSQKQTPKVPQCRRSPRPHSFPDPGVLTPSPRLQPRACPSLPVLKKRKARSPGSPVSCSPTR